MQLHRLAYGSKVVGRLTKADLKQILASSVRNNAEAGISGVLCFNHGLFFQILEGTRAPLNKTFQRISRDVRHADVVVIGLEAIAERGFGRWTMALIDESEATTSIIYKHCGANQVSLDYITMPEAVALATDLLKVS